VHPWRVDLTDYIVPGKRAGFQYLPEPYDFSGFSEEKRPTAEQISQAIQLVRSYLILYRGPDNLQLAPPLQILDVEKNSNAFRAGLQEEDYLESYDDIRPESIEGLRAAIRAAEQAGKERIPVVILRGTERLEMTVAPGRLGVNLLEI